MLSRRSFRAIILFAALLASCATLGSLAPIPTARAEGSSSRSERNEQEQQRPATPTVVYSSLLGGGANGIATAVAVDPSGNTYLTGSTQSSDFPTLHSLYPPHRGGVAHSEDGGESWNYPGEDPFGNSSVKAIVADPSGSGVVYAATSGAGLLKSADGGVRWQKTGKGLEEERFISAIAVDPRQPSTVYAASIMGVFRSTDGGASWQKSGNSVTAVSALLVDAASGKLYAGNRNGVYVSTDQGSTWSAINGGLSSSLFVRSIFLDPAGNGIYLSTIGGLYRKAEDQDEWQRVRLAGTIGDVVSIVPGPESGTLYANTGRNIYVSRDSGRNWRSIDLNSEILSMVVDPNQPNTIFLATNREGIVKSTDGGATWSRAGKGLYSGDVTAMAIAPGQGPNLYAATSPTVTDGFVMKLGPDGKPIYTTLLGGTGENHPRAIATDDQGNAYVTGRTKSRDFPSVNPFQATNNGGSDVFVAKIDPTGSKLVFSTLLGGNDEDNGQAVAVDGEGNVYLAGMTCSEDFPTANALQPERAGHMNGFVAKLSPDGSKLIYSTHLGGHEVAPLVGQDISSIAVDRDGAVYFAGEAVSPDFPLVSPLFSEYRGTTKGVVGKLSPDGRSLSFSSYLPIGKYVESASSIALDPTGAILVAGVTTSTDFPLKNPLQTEADGGIGVSKDGGSRWESKNRGLPDRSIKKILFDPSAPGTIYLLAYLGRISKSTDGGESWSDQLPTNGLDSPIEALSGGGSPFTLLATTQGTTKNAPAVSISRDGGQSWQQGSRAPDSSINELLVDPNNPNVIYAATERKKLQKSVDGGTTWQEASYGIAGTEIAALAMDPRDPSVLFAGVGTTILKSTDGAASWKLSTGDLSTVNHIVVSPVDSAILYAATSAGVFKSADAGKSWQLLGLKDQAATVVAVDPRQPDNIFAGTKAGVFRSTDGGKNWSDSSRGLPTGHITVLAFDPSDGARLYAGGPGQRDGILVKLAPDGRELLLSTYIGGSREDTINAVATDKDGSIYLAGYTTSPDFLGREAAPTDPVRSNGFLAKLSSDGSRVIYSTLLGGDGADVVEAVAIDGAGNGYVAGFTESKNFPVVGGTAGSANRTGNAPFLAKLSPDAPRPAVIPSTSPAAVASGAAAAGTPAQPSANSGAAPAAASTTAGPQPAATTPASTASGASGEGVPVAGLGAGIAVVLLGLFFGAKARRRP